VLSLTSDERGRVPTFASSEVRWGYEGTEVEVFGRGFARARLWEHYADDHHGVCLAFKRDPPCALVAERPAGKGKLVPKQLSYSLGSAPRTLTVNAAELLDWVPGEEGRTRARRMAQQYFEEGAQQLFMAKLADWATESEFRFVCIDNSSEPYIEAGDLGSALHAVVLGHKFPSWQIPAARLALRDVSTSARLLFVSWYDGRPIVTDSPGIAAAGNPHIQVRYDHPDGLPRYIEDGG
jgi:hypothetical protein